MNQTHDIQAYSRYRQIIQEICHSANIANWQELSEHGLLVIDGIEMLLKPERVIQDECIVLYVDFSVVPTHNTQGFLRLLLELNFMADSPESRTFSTHPETDQVIAMRRIPLTDKIDGETMIEILYQEAQTASDWQHEWPDLVKPEEPLFFPMTLRA